MWENLELVLSMKLSFPTAPEVGCPHRDECRTAEHSAEASKPNHFSPYGAGAQGMRKETISNSKRHILF